MKNAVVLGLIGLLQSLTGCQEDTASEGSQAEFQLVGMSIAPPSNVVLPIGVTCRVSFQLISHGASYHSGAFKSIYSPSDTPSLKEGFDAEVAQIRGAAYNKSLVTKKNYPYSDICRPYEDPKSLYWEKALSFGDFGFRDLQVTSTPVDLGEAARRGTLASLAKLSAANPIHIDKADMFGMTPLAWAVAYRRGQQIDLLLRAGASPAGALIESSTSPERTPSVRSVGSANSPVQVARSMHWRAMVVKLLERLPDEDRVQLADKPKVRDEGLRELGEWLAAKAVKPFFQSKPSAESREVRTITARVKVSARGQGIQCRVVERLGVSSIDDEFCPAILARLAWNPALDDFGDAEGGEGLVTFRVRPEPSDNN